ncbi:uncharacterized protein [Periplaneta americana]|uniref:uncharacterized protein n=1 Tax=Periplaneta americana TaxID=6978 RepID=UPI0037E70871
MTATREQQDFDIDQFILSIESKPALWDSRVAEYSNKVKKQECWREVCSEVVANFKNFPEERQREIGNDFQRRWRGMRSSFSREILKQKTIGSGSGAKARRRKYVFYDILSFLLPVTKTRSITSNMEDSETEEDHPDTLKEEQLPIDKPEVHEEVERRATAIPTAKKVSRPPKRKLEEESQEKPCSVQTESAQRRDLMEDDTRHFFLSLVEDFKSIPPQHRLDAKLEIIQTIKKHQARSSCSSCNPI